MTEDKKKKYEKKLQKARELLSQLSSSTSAEAQELKNNIEKYEKKLSDKRIEPTLPVASPSSSSIVASQPVDTSGITLLLFYAYIEPAWSPAQHSAALHWAEQTLAGLNITGRLRIAREGFNGTLTGGYAAMRQFTSKLREYDAHLANMNDKDDFKMKDNLPEGQKFPKLKVFAVKELVNYGLGVDSAPSVTQGGVHLDPQEYHMKLQEPNTVVIDVRNSYEAEIGRFNPTNGATYIDPKMRVSTEFPIWARENIDKYRDKQVLMYCTGGIRCERASALFRSLGHDKVFQLKGGIHNYLEEYGKKGDGLWIGDNYTFDKRFAHGVDVPAAAASTGPTEDAEQPEDAASNTIPKTIGKCAGCSIPWSKYRGKRRCPTCGVPLLLCTNCLKTDADKKGAKCHLCQEDERVNRKPFNKKLHYAEIMGGEEEGGGHSTAGAALGKRQRPVPATHTCGVCEEAFKSRNALFKHIKDSGHANRKAKKMKKG